MSKIVVIGAGYVGLVTAACFAQKNNKVVVVEKDQNKIVDLLEAKVPFYEPKLDALVQSGVESKSLIFVSDIAHALKEQPEIIFSCVGTPPHEDGSVDLSFVEKVACEIGQHMQNDVIVVNKSTVPVGTTKKVSDLVQEQLTKRGVAYSFEVVSNPEFLKEGDAVDDFMMPDRIIVGAHKAETIAKVRALYAPFLTKTDQFLAMNPESAELSKYAANAMLATRISFMNQLALLADKVGADIAKVKRGMSYDARIGASFLNAGIGYGGSCFPKDVQALEHLGIEHKQPMTLISEVHKVNDAQRAIFLQNALALYNQDLKGKVIGVWGIAFKPETDDIRCAPSLDAIELFLKHGAHVIAYDPVAMRRAQEVFNDKITYAKSAHEVLNQSDALIICTEWSEFLSVKPQDFAVLKDKTVFDGRNCFDPLKMKQAGISYLTVGRNKVVDMSDAVMPQETYSTTFKATKQTQF